MKTSASGTLEAEEVRPAPPVLASTLLDLESDLRDQTNRGPVWYTGVKRLDTSLPEHLWTAGRVIGLVSGQGTPNVSAVQIDQKD